jgi:hypothetical protein
MSKYGHHKNKTDEAAIGTLSSETHHKSLINLSEETSKWRDFKRDEEDHY